MTKRRTRRSIERAQAKKTRASRGPRSHAERPQNKAPFLQALSERFIYMESDDFQHQVVRLLQESTALREEPELVNLYFPGEQTLEAAERNLRRFRRRIDRTLRRSPGAAWVAYDEYRIAVIDDLDTVPFREELHRRVEQCRHRFMSTQDLDNLHMTMVISALTSSEEAEPGEGQLPLGMIGLVTAIYEASFDRAMETVEDARDRISGDLYDMWCALRRASDMDIITAATERVATEDHPAAFEELVKRVEADPDLALAWERQEGYLIEALTSRMLQGGVGFEPLPFKAQVTLVMDRVEQRALSKPWNLSRYIPLLALRGFASCARETLDEELEPSEIAAVVRSFEALGQAFLECDDEQRRAWVPRMVAAVRHLRSEPVPSRNAIVRMVFAYAFVGTLVGPEASETLSPFWRRLAKSLDRSVLLRILTPGVS